MEADRGAQAEGKCGSSDPPMINPHSRPLRVATEMRKSSPSRGNWPEGSGHPGWLPPPHSLAAQSPCTHREKKSSHAWVLTWLPSPDREKGRRWLYSALPQPRPGRAGEGREGVWWAAGQERGVTGVWWATAQMQELLSFPQITLSPCLHQPGLPEETLSCPTGWVAQW